MPQVKAQVACFIDNSLRQEGEVFEYNGPPNRHVVAIDATQCPGHDADAPAPAPRPRKGFRAANTAAA